MFVCVICVCVCSVGACACVPAKGVGGVVVVTVGVSSVGWRVEGVEVVALRRWRMVLRLGR